MAPKRVSRPVVDLKEALENAGNQLNPRTSKITDLKNLREGLKKQAAKLRAEQRNEERKKTRLTKKIQHLHDQDILTALVERNRRKAAYAASTASSSGAQAVAIEDPQEPNENMDAEPNPEQEEPNEAEDQEHNAADSQMD